MGTRNNNKISQVLEPTQRSQEVNTSMDNPQRVSKMHSERFQMNIQESNMVQGGYTFDESTCDYGFNPINCSGLGSRKVQLSKKVIKTRNQKLKSTDFASKGMYKQSSTEQITRNSISEALRRNIVNASINMAGIKEGQKPLFDAKHM